MSRKSRSKAGGTKGGNWSGAGATREQPLHRWQDANTATSGRARSRRPVSRWLIAAALGLGLLVSLLCMLLWVHRWTPVIVLTATDYSPPFPLNSWATEDRDALKALHEENLRLIDISDKWSKQPSALRQLLEEAAKSARRHRREPLIVHISMHGVVDDEGRPCLLPPGAAPDDTKAWIPVEKVLNDIRDAAPAPRKTLVILDCNRIRASWQLGIVYNSFSERMKQLVESKSIPNMAVLCSAGPGQINWASADLHGSSFGRHLQLGLAGEADEGQDGNGNGAVTLHELVAYLRREVDAWSRFNRGEPQTPILMPANAADFRLTWNSGTLDELANRLREQKPAAPNISTAAIQALWSDFEVLRPLELNPKGAIDLDQVHPLGLVRQDALACRDLEQGLLRLEALSNGGSAYSKKTEEELLQLKSRLSQGLERKKAAANSPAVADHLGFATSTTWARIPVAAHSLPVAAYFGACNADVPARMESLWAKLIAGTESDPLSIVEQAGESEREIASDLGETQLLISAQQQNAVSLWSQRKIELGDALKLRNRAEELAVPRGPDGLPGDERAHYYARHAANAADERRRLSEDVLFIGERHDKHYADEAAEANELYDWTGRVMQEATAAYAVHDAALAETPYLAMWLCGPAVANIPTRSTLVNNELLRLIRETRDLGQAISQPEKLNERDYLSLGGDLPFNQLAGDVLKRHQSVNEAFRKATSDLAGLGAQGPAACNALDAALLTPLIPASQRGELLKNRAAVSSNLNKQYFESRKEGNEASGRHLDEEKGAASNDSLSPYQEQMQAWDSHPLVEILLPTDSSKIASELEWCENSAARLRSRLARLPSDESPVEGEPKNAASSGVFRDRQRLSRAERELRASAPISFGWNAMTSDPILELRQFDLRQLLVWHGQRAMQDFWGDDPQTAVDEPFFYRAAKHYFDAAMSLGSPPSAVRQQVNKLQDVLVERKEAKLQPIGIRAKPDLVNQSTGEVAVGLVVGANALNYPAGRGAFYLKNQSGQNLDFRFEKSASAAGTFVTFPLPSAEQRFLMALSPASKGPRAEALCFFRGRVDSSGEFPLPTFDGIRIDYRPFEYPVQSITLSGDRPERLSIVFILDCSYSMKDPSRVEAQGAEEDERMQLAKISFDAMLADIVKRNRGGDDTRVGVRFFGHRLTWTTPPPGGRPAGWTPTMLPQVDYKGEIPKDLTPSEDVELVQGLGRFDGNAAARVRLRLNSVQAWGETPLYLAMMEALKDFDRDDPDTRKSIVAITDGEDKQSLYNPGGRKPKQTTLDMLLAEWERRSSEIPIHVLGFDVDEREGEAARARATYKRLADVTGGSYTDIYSGSDLLNQLREHLNVAGYIVKTADGRTINATNQGVPEPTKLGSPVVISNAHTLPDNFQVLFRMVPPKGVRLEGGEAIQLHVVPSGASHNIVANPYDKRPTLEPAVLANGAGGPETNYILRVHRPVRRKESVEFPVSLQQDTNVSHFTPRPAETWLEVTPLSANGTGESSQFAPYVFYDTNYVKDEPVPVLSWEAIDWPDESKRARIQFWCKLRGTDHLHTIGLRDAAYRDFQKVPQVAGVQLKVETSTEPDGTYRVHVVENHGPQSPGIDALRVQFQTDPRYKPTRVTHQFDRDTGIATHSFYYRSDLREAIERDERSRVVLTRADAIKDGAMQISGDSAIEVDVQPVGGFLSTGAVSNGE
jgi:hypothetical protein